VAVREFKLPDPGEGLTEAEVVTWRVAVGDTVKVNDIVVEVETAKSLVELPIPYAGTVRSLLVEEGQTVEVGTPIIAVSDGADDEEGEEPPAAGGDSTSAPADSAEPAEQGPDEQASGQPAKASEGSGRTAVLVGYGVKQTEAKRRPRRKEALKQTIAAPPEADIAAPPSARPGAMVAEHATHVPRDTRPVAELARAGRHSEGKVLLLAKPPVRKLAKDLGVDLASLTPTGPDGTISREDVERAAGTGAAGAGGAGSADGSSAAYAGGAPQEERIPIKGVTKVMAQAMVDSAFTAPHVTEWLTVDVTETMDLVARVKKDKELRDLKITPLTVLARAVCLAVRRNPGVNATWDEEAQEIVRKAYVNLGIAAATPRGLVVPNIKGAESMGLAQLARALEELTSTAREGRTAPGDMTGGSLTITNVGVFGVDAGTPIINPGEAAILAFGAVSRRPWVVTGADGAETIAPRWVSTLALSFDHRMVDGELGSRFLADVGALLESPARALVWS
jgi:2-oxoisovalerate dehydrogenase E2 component (dihydrolipoyl transacylase)